MMGNFIDKFRPNCEFKLFITGLDAAGKTTLLYKMKLNRVESTIPTIGFNMETWQHEKLRFTTWDYGYSEKMKPLWRHCYQDAHALIFVVDSSDHERLQEAAEEFNRISAEDDLRNAVVMVMANKQDLETAININIIAEAFQLYRKRNKCNIFPVSVITEEGLTEAFDWLAAALRNKAVDDFQQSSNPTGPSMLASVTGWFKSMINSMY